MPTILITGASGGLAQEMVKLLPNDQLILLGRNKEKLAQLYGNHPHAELMEIDITDDSAIETLVAKDMVSMQVSDKDSADLTWSNCGFKNAILRTFSTVKEPNFVNLVQEFQGETGNIAGFRGLTCPRS